MIKKLLLPIIIFNLLSCKDTDTPPPPSPQSFYLELDTITPEDRKEITEKEKKTYHVDKKYRYEYRTGISGHYEYNYDIIGYDKDSNKVRGNINIRGKYGAGMVEDKDGHEKDLYVHWVENEKLAGKDIDGNEYEFVVE
ncbi:hypothetical protein NHF50_09960 [Flavobacterium sp. NRK F10]|uniref:Uncharacterized protein n=1 Tax=Flavobacterium sediminis TaxID=2201181 RepID=A0A2U8QVR8_9FLAO|nr:MULTISPECIES: hypothetical protein [Flavobacterium]AWM14169.1 hypothetical protein DI487_10130 [Flavobacterium sediminis]MCO6175367.1 hypothetical protein [Flavobacterium sp. NRK F10]